jgi:ligand-binding sensor domain-containing protein
MPGCISPQPDDARLPPANLRGWVNTVVEGPHGQLWFGARRGVVIRQPDGAWLLYKDDVFAARDVTDILFDSKGSTWFATHLGPVRVGPGGNVEDLTDPGLGKPLSLAEDAPGNIWVGTQAFGLHRFDGQSWQCYSAEDAPSLTVADCAPVLPGDSNQINALTSDGEGGLWVGTNRGLAHFDGQEFVPLPGALAAEAFDELHTLWRDPVGSLWIGVNYGVLIYDGSTVRRPVNAPFGLGAVHSIAGDPEGNVWVGTPDGLWLYRQSWEPLTLDDGAIPIPSGAMAQDEAGDLWFAETRSVLHRKADGRLERLAPLDHLASSSSSNRLQAILALPDGEVWFGSRQGVVRLQSDGAWGEIVLPFNEPVAVYAMVSDSDGGVWLGTDQGLGHLAPGGEWTPKNVDLPRQPVMLALLRTPDGTIWAGTSYGVMQVPINAEATLWDVRHGLPDQTVYSLYQDTAGQLWFGTHRGASRWIGGDPAFETVDGRLAGQEVRAITEDALGRVWFGTRREIIVRGDPLSSSYSAAAGLSLVRGLFTDRDGTVWIATANGIQQYRPGNAPPWVGFHLWAGNDLVSPRDGVLHVPWDGAAAVRIELDGGDLSTPFGELVFGVRMVGQDRTARYTAETTIHYDLPTGEDFAFQVTALDKDGNTSDMFSLPVQVAQTPLTRRPGFLWFLGIVIAVLVLTIVTYMGNIARKRWGEERVQQDISLTLRQQEPDSPNHLAEVAIRHLGLPGLSWRLQALRARNLAGFFEPVERMPATIRSRAANLDSQLELLRETLGLRGARHREAEQEEQTAERGLVPLGEALLNSAFPRSLMDRLSKARQEGRRVRIRLSFDLQYGAELARLPWEYAYDPDLGFLARQGDMAMVRYLQVDAPDRRRLRRPLRILVVIASPSDIPLPAIRTDLERSRLEEALGELIATKEIELQYLVGPAAARMDRNLDCDSVASGGLYRALDERLGGESPFHVVHFVGHAGPHDRDEQEGVAWGDMVLYGENAQGEYAPLGRPQLVGILEALAADRRQPLLFFLNACQTVRLDAGQALAGLVPELITRGKLPAVIGLQYPIGDAAAILLAEEFYTALLRHGQVDRAISIARHALAQPPRQDLPDWGMPVLYLQARDGFIFKTY